MDQVNRREFVAAACASVLVPGLLRRVVAIPGRFAVQPGASLPLPTVTLGKTGRILPRLGLGCFPLGNLKTDAEGVAIARRALEAGVRYLDTAPSYGGGTSERRVGMALKVFIDDSKAGPAPVTREDFFIATKTLYRDAAGARRDLEASLTRLGVVYVDSVQVHEVHDDVDKVFEKGGVLETLEKARDEGLIRHISVTGHRNPKWLIRAIERYPFATALVPINPLEVQHLSFIKEFLPVAAERGVAVIAMKIYAGGHLVQSGALTAAECFTYALAQPAVAIAVPGCDRAQHVDEAAAAARAFKPPTPEELAAIEKKAGEHRGKESEWYKDAK